MAKRKYKKYDDDEDLTFGPDEEEDNIPEVEVKFNSTWSIADRMQKIIEGSQISVDEIIKSIHQPMDLKKNKDEKYKAITEGRKYAILTSSEILLEIQNLQKKLEQVNQDGKMDTSKSKITSIAEMRAMEKK